MRNQHGSWLETNWERAMEKMFTGILEDARLSL
jgi:hypothetical protein